MFDPKTEKTSFVVSNIRAIKIIAIILGLLIIIGLIFLFWGLGKKYNKLNNTNAINKTLKDDKDDIEYTNIFDFNEPTEAQLISSSLGTNNEILLRYLYKGKNTLVVLDVKTKKIKSIVTIKKGQNSFKIN